MPLLRSEAACKPRPKKSTEKERRGQRNISKHVKKLFKVRRTKENPRDVVFVRKVDKIRRDRGIPSPLGCAPALEQMGNGQLRPSARGVPQLGSQGLVGMRSSSLLKCSFRTSFWGVCGL